MIMVLFLSITLLIILLYSFAILFFSVGIRRFKGEPGPGLQNTDPVSLIIPFRDEEMHLPDLVSDLSDQSYPEDQFEVIFINDHSRDGSNAVLNMLIGTKNHFRCLDLPEERSGKKEALAFGVQQAQNDWIIQTDADCRLGTHFIASHMAFREVNPSDLVAGLVTTSVASGGFLESFERLDLLSLVGAGAGSFHYDKPLMCNGANLAFSRELYRQTRQFDPGVKVASGDDMFLMIGARKLGKILSYNPDRKSMVLTSPVRRVIDLVEQRIRWGSKTVHYGMIDIQLFAVLMVLTHLLILIIPALLFIFPGLWPWLLTGFAMKTMTDFALLYKITGITGQRKSLWVFLPCTLLYYPYHLVVLSGILLRQSSWKGRQR